MTLKPYIVVSPSETDTAEHNSEVAKQIEHALEEIFGENRFDIETTFSHNHWERGEPCPECGCEIINVVETRNNKYVSEEGEMEYIDSGHAIGGDDVWIACNDCGVELYCEAACRYI
jgi:hypothetical protein